MGRACGDMGSQYSEEKRTFWLDVRWTLNTPTRNASFWMASCTGRNWMKRTTPKRTWSFWDCCRDGVALNLDMTVLIHQNIRWFEIRDFFYHPLIWSYISCLVLGPARQKGPQLAKLGTRWELWALERYLCNEQRFLDFHLDTGVGYSSCRMVDFCEVTPNFQSSCIKRSIGTLFGESPHKNSVFFRVKRSIYGPDFFLTFEICHKVGSSEAFLFGGVPTRNLDRPAGVPIQ